MLFAHLIADRAHFDLALEITDSERGKPWPSGIHAKTPHKKQDLRAVLIGNGSGARMKRTSCGWYEFSADAQKAYQLEAPAYQQLLAMQHRGYGT